MNKQNSSLPGDSSCLRLNSLSQYTDIYRTTALQQGFQSGSVQVHLRVIAALDRWLKQKRILLSSLNAGVTQQFLRSRKQKGRRGKQDASAMKRLLTLLCELGVVALPAPTATTNPIQQIIDTYRRYLLEDRRLSPATLRYYTASVREFLSAQFPDREPDLPAIRAADVIDFVRRNVQPSLPARARQMGTTLRSFFRYLYLSGASASNLAGAVPAVAYWPKSGIPRFLPPKAVQQVLAHCDRRTRLGKRDYAILLLLARLGLRGGEVASLHLEDIDWKSGQITIRGKKAVPAPLPLPVDVGEAIAAYLRFARPSCSSRRVFVHHRPPRTGFSMSSTISGVVRRALHRAGVESVHQGAHLFRHSLATSMLGEGCSLEEIGELLRHQSPDTTTIYAKVDVEALRELALPWPGGTQ